MTQTNVQATIQRLLFLLEQDAQPIQQVTVVQQSTTTTPGAQAVAGKLFLGGWFSFPYDEPIVVGDDIANWITVGFPCRVEIVRVVRKSGTGAASFDVRRAAAASGTVGTFTTLFAAGAKPAIGSGVTLGGQNTILSGGGALLAADDILCWDVLADGGSAGVTVQLWGQRL